MNEVMLKNFYPGILGLDKCVSPNIYFLPAKETNNTISKNFYPDILHSDKYASPNIYFLPAKETNNTISKNFYPDILHSDKYTSPNIYFLPDPKLQNDTLELTKHKEQEDKKSKYKKYLMIIGGLCALVATYFVIKRLVAGKTVEKFNTTYNETPPKNPHTKTSQLTGTDTNELTQLQNELAAKDAHIKKLQDTIIAKEKHLRELTEKRDFLKG